MAKDIPQEEICKVIEYLGLVKSDAMRFCTSETVGLTVAMTSVLEVILTTDRYMYQYPAINDNRELFYRLRYYIGYLSAYLIEHIAKSAADAVTLLNGEPFESFMRVNGDAIDVILKPLSDIDRETTFRLSKQLVIGIYEDIRKEFLERTETTLEIIARNTES